MREMFVACAHVACVSSACLYVGLEYALFLFAYLCVHVGWWEGSCVCVCCLEGRELFREGRWRESMERVRQNERRMEGDVKGSAQSGSSGETDLVSKKV